MLRNVNARKFSALIAALGMSIVSVSAHAQALYRWVDENGKVHYGDRIPPEYANNDREILNEQGITVGFEEGEITPEEQAELDRIAAAEAERQRERDAAAARDQMLLATYVSVTDIEDLRDRRINLLESQINVTELYLTNLRSHLESLEALAGRYEAQSAEVPENIVLEIDQTSDSVHIYEKSLVETRKQQDELRAAFDADIARFAELKQAQVRR